MVELKKVKQYKISFMVNVNHDIVVDITDSKIANLFFELLPKETLKTFPTNNAFCLTVSRLLILEEE